MLNFLSPTGFRFVLNKAPIFSSTLQSVAIPSINLGTASQSSPHTRINYHGNITYDPLVCSFKVTENMENYIEILDWMKDLGHPENYNQYKKTKETGILMILNSKKNVNKKIEFTDIYPINISIPNFDVTDTSIEYFTASVTFNYTSMLL